MGSPRRARSNRSKKRTAPARGTAPLMFWKTRDEAAKDLSSILGERITGRTLTKVWLSDSTCPLPKGRGNPIPKAPLITWAQTMRRRVGSRKTVGEIGPSPAAGTDGEPKPPMGSDQLRAQEMSREVLELEVKKLRGAVRQLEIKNQKAEGELLPLSDVRDAIRDAGRELQREMLQDIPSQCATAAIGKTPTEASQAIADILRGVLDRFSTGCLKIAQSIAPVRDGAALE